ncbi:unnamed protein product [Sphagnum tenellum]
MQSLVAWARALWEPKEVTLSRGLVQRLGLPSSTAQFVLALQPPESPESVVYLLSTLQFSERSVSDARKLIAAVKPKAVVSLVDVELLDALQDEEDVKEQTVVAAGGGDAAAVVVPTTSLGVVVECLLGKSEILSYESKARILAAKSIFGTGLFGDVLEAKSAAAELGTPFYWLGFSYRDDSSSLTSEEDDERTKIEVVPARRAANSLAKLNVRISQREREKWREFSTSFFSEALRSDGVVNIASSNSRNDMPPSEETVHELEELIMAPDFAKPLYPYLTALYEIYKTPAFDHALQCTRTMLYDVEAGREVNSQDLLEACRFRLAVEMLRVQGNASIPFLSNTVQKETEADFSALSYENKCNALLAQSLRQQAAKSGTVVAIMDVNRVAGIWQHWTTPVPEEVSSLTSECYITMTNAEEGSLFGKLLSTPNQHTMAADGSQEAMAVVMVGAGAAAAVSVLYLPKLAAPLSPLVKLAILKVSTGMKLGYLSMQRSLALAVMKGFSPVAKVLVPSMKASTVKSVTVSAAKTAITAEQSRATAQSVVALAQKSTLSAVRTSFYSLMRWNEGKPVGRSPWLLFGSCAAAGSGILLFGDRIESAIGAVPLAPTMAKLGRGLESLSQASQSAKVGWNEVYDHLYSMKGKLKQGIYWTS